MQGVRHVIADAAYDADPLRAFIADNLGAAAQIKANPSRSIGPAIDWRLYQVYNEGGVGLDGTGRSALISAGFEADHRLS